MLTAIFLGRRQHRGTPRRVGAPGTVNISEDVYRQVHGRLDAALQDMGTQELKNTSNPLRVYRVDEAEPTEAPAPATPRKSDSSAAMAALARHRAQFLPHFQRLED